MRRRRCRLGLESRLLLSCITYKRHTASKHCALVLAVWLASLLGWTLKEIYDSNQPSYLSAAWRGCLPLLPAAAAAAAAD